jgi:hypothetical protein
MTSKSIRFLAPALLAGLVCLPAHQATAQSDEAAIKSARGLLRADRKATVAQTLQLTEKEAGKFWPLYAEYRAELDNVGDQLMRLVKVYAEHYPDIPEDRAKELLNGLVVLEKKKTGIRATYLKKFGKFLPAEKNLRFAQIENRLDLALRLKLAALIPLTPIEGRFTPEVSTGGGYTEGTPGGIVVQTVEIRAKVAAIDKAARKITVVSPDGIKKTIKAGPEVVNFDQIRIGDELKVTAAEETVVQMVTPGEPVEASVGSLVALAPKGAKPGALMAETAQFKARIQAIDLHSRKVTLRFPDGTTRLVAVREDVNLEERKPGEEIIIRSTETLAISISRP